ncbi:MAG TPA: hypothetical protein VNV41_11765 [Candidatus Acidoferrales bacterium]|nr:hypothetical protein [Candidatus Acidoferrales bacterium]
MTAQSRKPSTEHFLMPGEKAHAHRQPSSALSSALPVKLVFAMLAVCPFVVAACVLAIGRLQRQLARIKKAQTWDETGALQPGAVPAHE